MSKFEPLESYLSAKGQYKLLPLRFESISDDEVVLTNAVGEFTFLSRSKLQDLVARRLGPEDPDYAVLRAKHFIREEGDEAALELLALKTRTRLSRLANFTNLHIFVVSLRCDHSCQYCQVSRQSEDKADLADDLVKEGALFVLNRTTTHRIHRRKLGVFSMLQV